MEKSKKIMAHQAARKKFLELSLESTRKSYYPLLRKQLENAKVNEKSLQLLIDNLPAQISYVDSQERYILVNREFERSSGYKRNQIIGKKMEEILGHEIYSNLKSHIKTALSGKSGRFEFSYTTSKNRVKWYEINYVAQKDRMGNVNGVYVLTIDLTYKKEAEKERLVLKDRLRQSQKMEAIGTLAGGIAHDFNNILGVILGYSDLLKETLPPDEATLKKINQIIQAGNRAKDLVSQILAFSRQSEKELLQIQPDLVIKEALKMLRASIPTTIKIHRNIPGCGSIIGDPTQLHQIIMNLCTNAYHAMRDTGGELSVSLKTVELEKNDIKILSSALSPGPYLKLEISDTGHGIEKAIQDKIFDPYFTTKKKGDGTGLGLAVVHGVVKNFGGHISVYSEPGEGSVFSIYFPKIISETETLPDQLIEPSPGGTELIMVVDDEETIVQMEEQMLKSLGYRVSVCTNSPDALEMFKNNSESFSLIITDMTMPDMTGVELMDKIRKIKPEIPIILCTGFSELINEEKAKKMNIDKFLMKPVLKRDLAIAIREVLDKR